MKCILEILLKNNLVIDSNGTKEWCLKGQLHREDGPAVENANGNKSWYLKGQLHREDGPAVECANGTKCWYLKGEQIDVSSTAEFIRMCKLKFLW